MIIKIAKEYDWEMGHRLPNHKGKCYSPHGHSYRMRVEIAGEQIENGMIMDYYDLSAIIKPIIEDFDHAFMCQPGDELMINFLEANDFKKYVLDMTSTVENIVQHVFLRVKEKLQPFKNIKTLKIRINETIDAYAEVEGVVN